MKNTILAIAALALLCSCVSLGSPSWIKSTYDSRLKEKDYLCAVGTGPDLQGASDSAMAALSTVFIAQVESFQAYRMTSQESSDGNNLDTSELIKTAIVTSSSEITGAQISDSYAKDGVFWARASLNRKKAIKLYEAQAKDLSSELAKQKSIALDKAGAFARFSALRSCLGPAAQVEACYAKLRVLSEKAYDSPIASLETLIKSTSADITISIEADCDASIKASVQSALASYCQSLGFNVDPKGRTRLVCKLDLSPIVMSGSPYCYTSVSLSLSVLEDKAESFSYAYEKRLAALSQSDADRKALNEGLSKVLEALKEAGN